MALPFRDESFDLVTSFDILYFEGIRDETALQETARVLRPGGRLLIRVPAFDWLRGTHDIKVSTAHRYTSKELALKLAKSGLEIELGARYDIPDSRATSAWLERRSQAEHRGDVDAEDGIPRPAPSARGPQVVEDTDALRDSSARSSSTEKRKDQKLAVRTNS